MRARAVAVAASCTKRHHHWRMTRPGVPRTVSTRSPARPHAAMSADAPPAAGPAPPLAPPPSSSPLAPSSHPPHSPESTPPAPAPSRREALSLPRGPRGSLVPHVGDFLWESPRWGVPLLRERRRWSHRGVEEQFRSGHTHIHTRTAALRFQLQREEFAPEKEKKSPFHSTEREGRRRSTP